VAASGAASTPSVAAVPAAAAPASAEGHSAVLTPVPTAQHAAPPSSSHARVAASHAKRVPAKAAAPASSADLARPPAEPPPMVRETPRVSPAPAATTRAAGNPVDACKGKMFIALEFCLSEQCDKPAARNHPMCVEWREQKKLRESSKPAD
jgi:serine/threonine-protein kinase